MDITIFTPMLKVLVKIIFIYLPLRIAVEFIEESGVIEKILKYISFLTRWYEITAKSLFPLITGWILGVYMGGTVLGDFHADKKISQDEANKIMSIWMFAHGLIDETVLFTAIGASLFWILGIRVFFAIFAVKLLIMLSKRGFSINCLG